MIRILHIVGSMQRGGIETFLMNIYRNIDRQKIQFDFMVHTNKECDYDQEVLKLGGKIYSITPRRNGIMKNKMELNEFFKEHKEYKIVHQHVSSLTYVEPLKAAKKNNVKIRIIHSHSTIETGGIIHKFFHKYNQFFLKSYATNYLACSDTAGKWLYSRKQYYKRDFQLIKNAINTDKFTYNQEVRKIMRKELGIENKFVVGHIGRFTYLKNHDFLIDIFKEIYDKKKNSVLLLVGDGDLHKNIQEKVNRLNLSDNVIFTGVRSDISELLQAMDVFLMPSHNEGLPVTLIEAQAAGLPCVISKNITNEVEIVKCIEWCALNESPSIWAKKINNSFKSYSRDNTKQEIINAGFDIYDVSYDIQKMYIESINDIYKPEVTINNSLY